MVLKLCSRCKKRVAVIYMQRIENGNTVNEVGITPDIEAEGEEVLDAALKELKE